MKKHAMENQRLDFLDFSRGIAALLVFVSHAGASTGYFSKLGYRYEWVDFGQAGIITFFFVSGFVIPWSLEHSKSLRSFAIRRIFRLYPLFVCLLGLSLVLQMFGIPYPMPLGNQPMATVMSNLFMVWEPLRHTDLVLGSWTLTIEIVWYAAFGLLFHFGLQRDLRALAIATATLFIGVATVSLVMDIRLPLGRLGMLGVCLLGYYCYKLHIRQIGRRDALTWMALLVASILFMLWTAFSHHRSQTSNFPTVLISWSIGLVLFCVPLIFRQYRFFQMPVFMRFGRHSYSIYLAHPPILFFCRNAFTEPAVSLLCSIVMLLGISALLFRFVEAPGIQAGKFLDRALASRHSLRYRQKET